MRKLGALVAGAILIAAVPGTAPALDATPNDVARFVAGLPPAEGSPLFALTKTAGWRRHARWFDTNWEKLEQERLSKVRRWSERNLKDRQLPLYYMFSGPDSLYALAFFPQASTYLLSGLEPVGAVPNLTERSVAALPRIQQSIGSSLRFSFFITREMREHLSGGELAGTLPILYAYIARSGMTVRAVELVTLDRAGTLQPPTSATRTLTPGVKIVLARGNGPAQTLYYFRTDLSNGGVNASGFLTFAATLGAGNTLLKSASYLMHSGNFTQVRDFVLQHSQAILQDDSGVPFASLSPQVWDLHPFGTYLGAIDVFPNRSQPRLGELFRKSKPPPLDFGIGYRHRGVDSHLLLAIRKVPLKPLSPPVTHSTPHPREMASDGKLPPLPPAQPLPPLRPSLNNEE